jgi:hypothetical protein
MPYVYSGPAVLADGDTEIPVLAQLGLDEQDTWGGVLTTNAVVPVLTAPRLRLPNGQQRPVRVEGIHRRRDQQDTLVDIWPGPRPRQDLHWPRPGKPAPVFAPERLTPEPGG